MNPTTPKRSAVISVLMASMTLMACSQKPEVLLTSAKAYLAHNDNKAAIIQIKNALQIAPNLAEARFLLGSALLDAGDLLGAEAELRKAIELKHPKEAVTPELAKALLAQGQEKKLIDEFAQTALALPDAQASLRMSLASAYAAQGQNDLAQVALSAALMAQPGYAPALLESAREMADKRDYDRAQAMADDVLASAPMSHDAWHLKGDIFWHGQGKPVDAVVAYRRAIQIKPDFLDSHASVITIFMQQGSLDEAAIQIEQLRKIAPKHPRVQYLSAQLAYQKKDFKQAKEMALEVLKTVPRNYQSLQMAGAAELELGNLTQAEGHLRSALEIVPTLSTARRLLIVTYLRSRQVAKAMEALLPGLETEPIDPDLLALAGKVYMQSGDINKGGEYLVRATKLAPDDARKKASLAMVHMRSGKVETAF
jgi:putative PEP-CTERM system TPR-repeat lipoprotein